MKYLTLDQRKHIAKMYNSQKLSFRAIAKVLGKHHSTISREVKRCLYDFKYDPNIAHQKFLTRQQNKGNTKKLDTNTLLLQHIIFQLQDDLSPEQIVHRMKKVGLHKEIGYVCHETIYTFIYDPKNKYKKLWRYLRRHRIKRKSYSSRHSRRSTIKHRTSIHDRPSVVNNRTRIGDWEADLMIFSKQKHVLSVHVERRSRLCRIYICQNKSKDEMYDTLRATALDMPTGTFKTITFDNGSENADHYKLTDDLGIQIDTFFCDPYSSWQKGTVENMNMFLRQYLPRHTDLSQISPEQLYNIQEKLNNRPRKCLNYLTPNESFFILSS